MIVMGRSRRLTAISVSASLLVIASLIGCHSDSANLETLSIAQVADLMKKDDAVVICDANGTSIRDKYGVVPGAVLLAGYGAEDITAALPATKNTPLVFYCSSRMCSAAPRAANKAVDAGYTDVYVMPEGIKGWVQAGQPVDKPPTG